MPACRLTLLVLVVALGCNRPYKRTTPVATTTPPEPVPLVPVPTPPSPPPLVPTPPPLAAVGDAPGLPDPSVTPAGHAEVDDTRREQRQKRREERREGPKPPEPKPAPTPAPSPTAAVP